MVLTADDGRPRPRTRSGHGRRPARPFSRRLLGKMAGSQQRFPAAARRAVCAGAGALGISGAVGIAGSAQPLACAGAVVVAARRSVRHSGRGLGLRGVALERAEPRDARLVCGLLALSLPHATLTEFRRPTRRRGSQGELLGAGTNVRIEAIGSQLFREVVSVTYARPRADCPLLERDLYAALEGHRPVRWSRRTSTVG
jgi:hypothetical protein